MSPQSQSGIILKRQREAGAPMHQPWWEGREKREHACWGNERGSDRRGQKKGREEGGREGERERERNFVQDSHSLILLQELL